MMKTPLLYLLCLALTATVFSCKKDKGDDEDDGPTTIRTLEVAHVVADGIYGRKYTFKVQFDEIGDVTEYGIVYKPWVGELQDKTPTLNGQGSFKVPFGASPSSPGTIETGEITLRYADFNDANYHAYAVTRSGQIIYGQTLYISFT